MTASKRVCKLEGCEKPVNAKDMCAMHYYREKRHGSTRVNLYDIDRAVNQLGERLTRRAHVFAREGDAPLRAWDKAVIEAMRDMGWPAEGRKLAG